MSRARFTFHLSSGAQINFRAEVVKWSRSSVDGTLHSFEIENARGEIPKSVDLAHVIAITRHFRTRRWWFLWLR